MEYPWCGLLYPTPGVEEDEYKNAAYDWLATHSSLRLQPHIFDIPVISDLGNVLQAITYFHGSNEYNCLATVFILNTTTLPGILPLRLASGSAWFHTHRIPTNTILRGAGNWDANSKKSVKEGQKNEARKLGPQV